MKDIIIESVKPRRRRKVPEVLNAPELPLDAPDYETYLKQLDKPQPTENHDPTDPIPRP